jgi:hypothetical protein
MAEDRAWPALKRSVVFVFHIPALMQTHWGKLVYFVPVTRTSFCPVQMPVILAAGATFCCSR